MMKEKTRETKTIFLISNRSVSQEVVLPTRRLGQRKEKRWVDETQACGSAVKSEGVESIFEA